MSKDFLLEIGLEEMPAKYVTNSVNQLANRLSDWLMENKVTFSHIETFSTPRRLAVIAKEVAEKQADRIEEVKGPAKKIALDESGHWSKAALGFAKSQNVNPDDFAFKEIKGSDYIYIKKEITGSNTIDLLTDCKKIVTAMTFPVSMHWGANELRYIRPIKWLIALFGEDVIPFEIAGVQTVQKTRGHRFLGKDKTIVNPAAYEEELKKAYVVADAEKRKQSIRAQIKEMEIANHWQIEIDEDLLEEVNNLVEYPTVLAGNFDKKYLSLPEEILITSMKEHQRYFPVFDQENHLLPHFVTVRNGNEEHLQTVAKGNEKVLRARLADGEFFYQEDLKITIDEAVRKLNTIVYHEKLGSLTEKMTRVQKVASMIADLLGWSSEKKQQVERVTDIYKFDLVTNVVDEFPELQGIMGEKYALLQGENKDVARAIREHYLPISSEGELPESELGALLAISDKLETVISFFAIGIIPSGSADPFGLRRSAFGVMRILKAKEWRLPLTKVINAIIELEREQGFAEMSKDELTKAVYPFFANRLRVILANEHIRADIIDAVTNDAPYIIPDLMDRAKLLSEHVNDEWFRPTIEALTRVLNIAKKHHADTKVDPDLFENEYERTLFTDIKNLKAEFKQLSLADLLKRLADLRNDIDNYFEHTLVMSDDQEIKNNRLALLFELATIIKAFAQVDEIKVK